MRICIWFMPFRVRLRRAWPVPNNPAGLSGATESVQELVSSVKIGRGVFDYNVDFVRKFRDELQSQLENMRKRGVMLWTVTTGRLFRRRPTLRNLRCPTTRRVFKSARDYLIWRLRRSRVAFTRWVIILMSTWWLTAQGPAGGVIGIFYALKVFIYARR